VSTFRIYDKLRAVPRESFVMFDDGSRQSLLDDEHLRLLALGYQIEGGVSACFSLFGLLYVVMGVGMTFAFAKLPPATNQAGQPPPEFVGWLFAGIGFFIFSALLVMALLKFRVAWCLKRRRSRTFCLVVGGISCLGIPYGLILGVFTFLVLNRNSVMHLFNSDRPQIPGHGS
jgi:hypothetical protein